MLEKVPYLCTDDSSPIRRHPYVYIGDDIEMLAFEDLMMEVMSDNSDSEEGSDGFPTSDSDDTNMYEEPDTGAVDPYNALLDSIGRHRVATNPNPPGILLDTPIEDLSCHPLINILAIATMDGDILLSVFNSEESSIDKTLETHSKACRAVEFSPSGDTIFSISPDKSIVMTDVESCNMKQFYDDAHDDPLTTLALLDNYIFSTGDEMGTVKLWDTRKREPIFVSNVIKDYITSLNACHDMRYMAVTSCDGSLTAFDLRQHKSLVQSRPFTTDLTCACLFRNETRLICGTSNGSYLIFSWGDFENPCEIYKIERQREINKICKATENSVISSWEDGKIRANHLYPHRHLGIIGQHDTTVESLAINFSKDTVVSACFQGSVKFWSVDYLENMEESESDSVPADKDRNLPSSEFTDPGEFFSDLA